MSITVRLAYKHRGGNLITLLLLCIFSLQNQYAWGFYPPDPPVECSSSPDDATRGRCLLDRVYQTGDMAAEAGLARTAYQQQAGAALAQIEEMDASPAWLLAEARFAWAWANDPDNSVFADGQSEEAERLTVTRYQRVCFPPYSETVSVEHDIAQLMCTVARQRIHLLQGGLDQIQQDGAGMQAMLEFIKRYPLLKSDTGLNEASLPLARRLVVLGLGFATAERAERQAKQATGLAFLMLSIVEAQHEPPDREATAFAAGIVQLVDIVRPAERPRQDYNIKLVTLSHRLVSETFPAESLVAINSNQLQADMNIDIALVPVYPPAMRSAAAAEAKAQIERLSQNALKQGDYATQRERLEVVQTLFERLEQYKPEPEQHPEFAAVCPLNL